MKQDSNGFLRVVKIHNKNTIFNIIMRTTLLASCPKFRQMFLYDEFVIRYENYTFLDLFLIE